MFELVISYNHLDVVLGARLYTILDFRNDMKTYSDLNTKIVDT